MSQSPRAFLQVSWQGCWRELAGTEGDPGLFEALLAAWNGPGRHYHTAQHLAECLQALATWQACARRPAEVALALCFHDAIYDARASDNEARSADWAASALRQAGVDDERIARIHGHILATARHLPTPDDPDRQLLLDLDLAILAAAPERFAEYQAQVRAEYAWVPEALYRQKRGEVLAGFLARQPLYGTAPVREALEGRARDNLGRAIAAAGMAPPPLRPQQEP